MRIKLNPQRHVNILVFLIFFTCCSCNEEFCYIDSKSDCAGKPKSDRFLLYDVNPPEGFNLRRDVYMRFAILAHKLHHSDNEKLRHFNLVLPPWSRLYHWNYSPEPEHIPWSLFFDVDGLKRFAPVIEMHEFFSAIKKTDGVVIDEAYVLQHFKDMFETGKFDDRMKIDPCEKEPRIDYFFYKNVTSNNVKCLSYHGPATKLSKLLSGTPAKSILLHHAEVALHGMFGDKLYWQCRRSMRFSRELREIANDFRKKILSSADESDETNLPEKWEEEKPHRKAKGGPYLGVHLRRRDFLRGRAHQVPSLESISKQLTENLIQLDLKQVFIATDATQDEYQEIIKGIPSEYKPVRFVPNEEIKGRFKDGGVAIIEQIICAHARHFIGTYESTFSFRIQEEREILGFPINSTFNSFCGQDSECPQPSVWKIVY